MLSFCSDRVPIYVHPCFYSALKLKYPLDVGGISWDGRVTIELGTGSLRQADGILTLEARSRQWVRLVGLMALNLPTLNVRGLRDSGQCARLLAELLNLGVNVATVQETHFICAADCQVPAKNFAVFSAYGSRNSAGVSLIVGRGLDADVDVVFAGDKRRLVVADVAVKSFKFRLVMVYTPKTISFFRRLAPSLDESKRVVLIGDWNVILDLKIDKVGWELVG